MNILAIIPARGGSCRLPHKNLAILEGETLLARTIKQARESRYINRVVVSTENLDIAAEAIKCHAQVIKRPIELALSGTPTLPVIQHALKYLEVFRGYEPDIMVLLQVTSPLRTVEDIDNTIKLMLESKAMSAETMCGKEENGAVYCAYDISKDLLAPPTAIYQMPQERSIDIDTLEDLQRAEEYLRRVK